MLIANSESGVYTIHDMSISCLPVKTLVRFALRLRINSIKIHILALRTDLFLGGPQDKPYGSRTYTNVNIWPYHICHRISDNCLSQYHLQVPLSPPQKTEALPYLEYGTTRDTPSR